MKGICPITCKEDDIRKSHIFPKFMWRYLKRNGGTVFRSVENPTKELQNGYVMDLLGSQAELKFSKRELWFEHNIFTPYVNGELSSKKVLYTNDLFYFCVSLLWRVLYIHRDNVIGTRLKSITKEALEDWRSFLNEEISVPATFSNVYIMPISSKILSLPDGIYDIDFYMKREFGDNIMTATNSADSAVYCKFPRFIIWGQLIREDKSINYGLRVFPEGGHLNFKKFHVGEGITRGYIIGKIKESVEMAEKISNQLSDNVQKTISNRIISNIDKIRNTEMGEILLERCFV